MRRAPNRKYNPANRVLWHAIQKKGYKTVGDLCHTETAYKLSETIVGQLINCKTSPLTKSGRYKGVCLALQEILDTNVETLFPLKLYITVLPPGIKSVTPFTDLPKNLRRGIAQLADNQSDGPADGTAREMLKSRIEKVLKTLSYREREIIKLRHSLGDGHSYTLEEVAQVFKATRERMSRIEAKAARQLQRPSRSQELVGFLD